MKTRPQPKTISHRIGTPIPPDMYDRVRDLALAITNASEAGDERRQQAHRQALRGYFEEQAALGRGHPFLTETLADYTQDATEAVQLYELAIAQSQTWPEEPTHTKMISLAERLAELGRGPEAQAWLRQGRAEAVRRADSCWVNEADRLQQGL